MPDKPSAFDLFNSKAIDPDALDEAIRKGEEFQSRYGASGEVNREALEKLRGRPKKTLAGQVGEAIFSEEGPVRQAAGRLGSAPGRSLDEGTEEYDRRISKNRRELAVRKREYWQGRSKELDEALVGSKGKATRMERIGKWAAETVESEALHSEYAFEQPGIADRLGQAGLSVTRGVMHGAVAGNLKGGALAYSYLHDIFSEEEGGPAEGYEAYKLGAFVAEKAEEMTDPRLKNKYLASTLPEGFGSMLAFWAGARGGASIFQAAKARQLAAGTAVLAQGSALESSALYEDALNSGASERVAKLAAPWGILLGATELAGAGQILIKWDKTTGGVFKHTLKEYWKHTAKGGMGEGLQEFFQQEGHEAIAVMIYRDHRRPIEESLEAGVTGGILGAMMGAVSANPSVKILRRKHAAQKFFDRDNDAAVRLASVEGDVSRSVFEEITGITDKTTQEYRNDFQGDTKQAIAGEILDVVDAETEKQIAEMKAKADAEAAAKVTDPILAALEEIAQPETDISAPVEEVAQPAPLEEVEDQPPPTVEQVVEQPAEAPAAVAVPAEVAPAAATPLPGDTIESEEEALHIEHWSEAETGTPYSLFAWHVSGGTFRSQLTQRAKDKLNRDTTLGEGWYGARDEDVAEGFATQDETPVLHEVTLQNPFVIKSDRSDSLLDITNEQLSEIRAAGHDGIIVTETGTARQSDRSHQQVILFAAPAEVAPAEPVTQQISPDVEVIQKGDAGTTITVDEDRVTEWMDRGMSKKDATARAAAEAVAPEELKKGNQIVEGAESQADAHVFGQSNTVVTSEEMANAIELLKQKGLAIGRGEKPTAGGVSAIDADMLKAIGKIGMYYAEALARANIKFTKSLFKKYLRNFAPFNAKHPTFTQLEAWHKKLGKDQPQLWLISDKDLNKAIKDLMEGTPEGMAAGVAAGAFNKVAKNVRRQTIINSIIRWNEGETVEVVVQKLLDWSMKRQEVSADQGYRAAIIDENSSWGTIIGIVQSQLPPEMTAKILPVLMRVSKTRRRTPKGRKKGQSKADYKTGRWKARLKVIEAVMNLMEQYERAGAIKGLKEMIAKSGVLSKDNKLRPETQQSIVDLIDGIILQDPRQSTLDGLESLRQAAELDAENETHQIPIALVTHAKTVLTQQTKRVSELAAAEHGPHPGRALVHQSIHKDMSAEDIRTLTETIGQLLNHMTTKNVKLARRKNMTLQEYKDQVAKVISDRFNANRSIEPGSADDIRTMVWTKKLAYLQLLSMDSMAHILGGRESAVYYIFSESLRRARDSVAEIQVEAQDHIRPVLESLGLVGPVLTEWSEMGSNDRGIFVTMVKSIRGQTKQAERIETPMAALQQLVVLEGGVEVVVEAKNEKEALAALTEEQRAMVEYTRPLPTAKNSETGKRVETISLTRAERVSLYLHLQDRDTRAEILSNRSKGITVGREDSATGEGVKLTIHDVQAIEASMTEAEVTVAKAMSEFINGSLLQQINAAWVEHHGTEITHHENYFPRTRDRKYFDTGVEDSARDWQQAHLDGQGIFRARSKGVVEPIVIFDAFSVYYTHTNRAASFIAKHGPLSDAFNVLNSSEFMDSMKANHPNGRAWISQMREMLKTFQGLEVRKGERAASEKFVKDIIRASHISALGLKPQIAIYQLASFIAAGTEINAKYLWQAKLEVARDIVTGKIRKEMRDESATLRHRLESGGHQILSPGYQGSALMEFYGATHRDYAGSAKDWIDKSSMAMIKKGDETVIATIWQAAKLEGAEQGLAGDALMEYTKNRAVDIIDQTQPTWDSLTSSQIQNMARHNALLKLWVMFSSQRNKNYNMVMRSVSDYSSSEKTKEDQGRLIGKLVTVLGAQSATVFYAGKWWFLLLAMMWGDDDELDRAAAEPWWSDVLEIGKKSLGNWLIVGDFFSSLVDVTRGLATGTGMPPSYRRQRGTILYGIGKDMLDTGQYLGKMISEYSEDERYPGLGPRAGRKKGHDSLSKTLDSFIRATGMVAGLPTGALMQVFGRAMPHRRPVKWKYEPVNQLNKLDTEWQRASGEINDATKKLEEKRGDRPALLAIIANAEKVKRDNHVAHEIWLYARSDILKNLAEAKRGLKVDETEVVMERTRLEHLADEYQSYAKTKDVRGLIETAGPAFLGTFVMDYTRPDPKVDPLLSRKRREEKVVDIAEARSLAKPLVEAMTFKQADVALRWGYMKSMDRPGLNVLGAVLYSKSHQVSKRKALGLVMEMKKAEVIGIILSKVYPDGPRAGEPMFVPETAGFDMRYDALRDSIGNRR